MNQNRKWHKRDSLKPFPIIDISNIWKHSRYQQELMPKHSFIKYDYYEHLESDENTPLLYLVIDFPGEAERQKGLLEGRYGSLIKYFLKGLNIRPFNFIVASAFDTYYEDRTDDIIKAFLKPLLADIVEKQPKTILVLGMAAMESFNKILKIDNPTIFQLRSERKRQFLLTNAGKTLYSGDIYFTRNVKTSLNDPLDCLCIHADISRAVLNTVLDMNKYSKNISFEKEIINIETMDDLDAMLSRFRKKFKEKGDEYCVAFDTETLNLLPIKGQNKLLAVSFSDSIKRGYCVLVDHKDAPWTEEEKPIVLYKLRKWFTKNSVQKVGFNSKFDINILRFLLGEDDIEIKNVSYDVMLMQYLFDMHYSNKKCRQNLNMQKPNSLGSMAKYWLQYGDESWYEMKDLRTVLSSTPGEMVYKYAAEDSILTFRLFKLFMLLLKAKHPDILNIAIPVLREENYVLAEMEFNGALIDTTLLTKLTSDSDMISMKKMFEEHEKEFLKYPEVQKTNELLSQKEKLQATLFGSNLVFNVKSNDHLIALFRDVMDLEPVELDKKAKNPNGYSTGKEFLEKYGDSVPLVGLLRNLREETKMIGFVKGFADCIYPDGKVHAKFNLNGTMTGRLSCFNPNMQQLPRAEDSNKGGLKHWIKKCFITPPGYCMIAGDYSTAEVRGGALVTKDKNLANTFSIIKDIMEGYAKNPTPEVFKRIFINSEADAHKLNYSRAFGVPVSEVTKEQRQQAKGITFQIMYSSEPAHQLGIKLGVSTEEAEKIINSFLGNFPQLKNGLIELDNYGIKNGYLYSPYGKIRDIYQFFNGNEKDYKHAVNASRNGPIQGFTSDTCLLGLRELLKYRREYNKDWKLMNVVHDAIYFYVPLKYKEIEEFLDVAKNKLSFPPISSFNSELDDTFVPMAVDFELGFNNCDMIHFDGSKLHLKYIYKWLKDGGDMKSAPTPGCYFTEEDLKNL